MKHEKSDSVLHSLWVTYGQK